MGYLLDALILAVPTMLIIGMMAPEELFATEPVEEPSVPYLVANLLTIVLSWLYFAFFESSRHQATLGKLAVGLRVTDLAGRRISFGRATGRYFAQILSAIILLIGYFMIGWTRRKQGLHDKIAGTLVYKKDFVPVPAPDPQASWQSAPT